MSEPRVVFIIGITGYIGGSVFTELYKEYPLLRYNALVRNPAHFSVVESLGVTPILGTFSDHDLIAKHVFEADITLNCADSDAVDLNEAVLDGMRKRREQGKTVGVLLHISGTAVFCDWSKSGKFDENVKMWNDGNVEDIKAITTKMFHGQVDAPILQAGLAGDVHSYIIAPSAVHGTGTSTIGKVSAFMKFFGGEYVKSKRVFIVGEGTNVVGFVHISDLVSLFLLVFNHALSFYPESPPSSPYERYYICSTRHVPWNVTAGLFANALYRRGIIPRPEVESITADGDGMVPLVIGSNEYTKEERGPALGWVRRGATLEETFEGDVNAMCPLK